MSAYTGTQYNIIGNDTIKFTGTFDGSGHITRNLTNSTTSGVTFIGLFGYTCNAAIRNLGIENINLYAGRIATGICAGGLVGDMDSGTITNCYNTSTITSSSALESHAGGLSGMMNGTITCCYNTRAITASSGRSFAEAGGLAGRYYGSISKCYSTGPVFAIGTYVYKGGLVGYLSYIGTVTSCLWDTQTSGQTAGLGDGSGDVTGKRLSRCERFLHLHRQDGILLTKRSMEPMIIGECVSMVWTKTMLLTVVSSLKYFFSLGEEIGRLTVTTADNVRF